MSKKPIFNPLFAADPQQQSSAVASDQVGENNVATAAMYNENLGQCPKCKTKMTTAVVANADSVFYCVSCRVSMPLEDGAA